MTPRRTRRSTKKHVAFSRCTGITQRSPPAQLQRSYSGRPWSQSSNNIVPPNVSAAAKTRKSLRGLGRSRVAAGMGGWMRNRQASVGGGLGEGVNRRASASDSRLSKSTCKRASRTVNSNLLKKEGESENTWSLTEH